MRVWQQDAQLRFADTAEQQVYFPYTCKVSKDPAAVARAIDRCNLMNPVLVKLAATGGKFLHPLTLPGEAGRCARGRVRRDRIRMICIALGWLLSGVLLAFGWRELAYAMMPGLLTLGAMTLYLVFDYWSVLRHRNRLEERARYYGWLFISSRRPVLVFVGLMVGSGAAQFIFGNEDFLQQFALLYDRSEFAWWRIISGAAIHASPAHWLANLVLGAGVAALSGPSLQRYFVPVFLVGGWLAFGGDFLHRQWFPRDGFDALVGTSGGIASLAGCTLALCLRFRPSYPYQLWLTILVFILVSLIIGAVFIAQTSLACHVYGLAAGAALSWLVPDYLEDGGVESGAAA